MFGRSKRKVDTSRFVSSAREIPYAFLYRYPEFTLAISRCEHHRIHPDRYNAKPQCLGVVHLAHGLSHDGSTEPLLPVQLTFVDRPHKTGHIGGGHLAPWNDGSFRLHVQVYDPDSVIYNRMRAAFHDAVLSDESFFHVHCRRSQEAFPYDSAADSQSVYERERDMLVAVEEGKYERLAPISFDEFTFGHDLTTKAPGWSWAWYERDRNHVSLQHPMTARWRRHRGF